MHETFNPYIQWTKRMLKPLYFSSRDLAVRTFRSYSPQTLEIKLKELGLKGGDSLLVHSAFNRANGFTGSPGDLISALSNAVGAEGQLLMMSMPYRGSSESYAASTDTFELHRTPSAMGVVSEAFRRQPDVLRSANPFHPVLARGPNARWLTADHEKSLYSCGKGSPFERLLSIDGKVLFFDVPFSTLTFMHYIEHYFQDILPLQVYSDRPAEFQVMGPAGKVCDCRQYMFSEEARTRRNFVVVERALLKSGLLAVKRIGNTRLMIVRVADVFECSAELVKSGSGIYK